MIPYLYRFRPIHAILDGYQELAKQEIYFSPPEDLNDPMEGYKDVFWLGDKIVWRNLLRHYLLCLLQSASLCIPLGPQFDPNDLKLIIFSAFDNLPQAPVRAIYQRACAAFFANSHIQSFIDALAARTIPLRRDELGHHLRAIHPFALSVLMSELKHHGVDGIFRDLDALHAQATTMSETVARVVATLPADQDGAEALFSTSELIVSQMVLVHDYNTPPPPNAHAITFLLRDFPVRYVQALDELIHPPCYAACFVADPANGSMWATYGDRQTGVCLKFKTTADIEGRPALNLKGITGWRGGPALTMEPVRSFHLRTFYQVNYSDAYPEIDFFNSIMRLPIPILNSVWFIDENGQRSTSHSAKALDNDARRKDYWAAFQSGATRKTSEWSHEQEYRLLLWSQLDPLKDKEARKLNYNFADLAGIIFGTKTSSADKLKIMRIVDEKCRVENRTDFEFHQVQYSRKDRSFRIAPLNLLRFSSSVAVGASG